MLLDFYNRNFFFQYLIFIPFKIFLSIQGKVTRCPTLKRFEDAKTALRGVLSTNKNTALKGRGIPLAVRLGRYIVEELP